MTQVKIPVPAATRTLQLLELLLANPQGLSARECITLLDVSRSTLFALLSTLKSLGYVEQTVSRGHYTPGPRLLAWRGPASNDPRDLVAAFYHEASQHACGETLALVVQQGAELLILAQAASTQRVRTAYETGERFAIPTCAAGAVLTSNPSQLVCDLGYAIQQGSEWVELALPVCSDGRHPDAALLLSAPRIRHSPESMSEHVPAMREMAARLSYRVGAPLYAPYQGSTRTAVAPSAALEDEELQSFLEGPWAASLACIRPDGTPHVVPVWHEWDGQDFYVAAWGGARWAAYLEANPSVSLTVDEPWPPLRRVTAHGVATAIDEGSLPGGVPAILDRLSRRFLGQPLRPTLDPDRAFRITPQEIRGRRGLRTSQP